MLGWLIAAAALASAQAPAAGESTTFGEAAGWNVQRRADGCFMMSGFGNSGIFGFFMNGSDGSQLVIFQNGDWQMSEETRRDFVLQFEGAPGSWRDLAGQVTAIDGGSSILISFDETARDQLLEDLGTASAVHLFRGEEQIEAVTLAGAPQGLAMLRNCLAAGTA